MLTTLIHPLLTFIAAMTAPELSFHSLLLFRILIKDGEVHLRSRRLPTRSPVLIHINEFTHDLDLSSRTISRLALMTE